MSYLANRNVSIFNSTITASTLNTNKSQFSTLMGSTLTISTLNASTLTAPIIIGTTTLGQNASYPNRFVEMGTDLANTMYLDFHSSDAALPDYSTRIQSLGGATTGTGNMVVTASAITLSTLNGTSINTNAIVGNTASGNTCVSLNTGGPANTRCTNIYYTSGGTLGSATGDYTVIQSGYGGIANTPIALNPSGGNVGIGTTSATTALQVNGTITGTAINGGNVNAVGVLGLGDAATPANGFIRITTASGTNYIQSGLAASTDSKADLVFGSIFATSEWMRIKSGGNVGIGISTPSTTLHVNGMTYIQGPTMGTTATNPVGNFALRICQLTTTGNTVGQIVGQMCFHGPGRPYASSFIRCITEAANGYDDAGALAFGVSNGGSGATEALRINQSGYVGIGTNAPAAILQINNNNASYTGGPTLSVADGVADNTGTYGMVQITRQSAVTDNKAHISLIRNGANVFCIGYVQGSNTVGFVAGQGNMTGSNGIFITPGGSVGIGTNAPGYALHVVGGIYSTGDIIGLSDQRYKKDIIPLSDSLAKIQQLNGYTYRLTEEKEERLHMGLLAQEVEPVFPEAVYYDKEKDTYGLNYNAIVAPLIEAMKELVQQNKKLTNDIQEIKQQLKDLQS